MRQQVEERSGQKVEQHLLDGGYLRSEDIAQAQGVELFVPSKPAKNLENRGRELEPQHGDSEAVLAWKRRMSPAEKQIYKSGRRRAKPSTLTCEVIAGLTQITVRGLKKAKCVALWCALAYNVLHFATALLT